MKVSPLSEVEARIVGLGNQLEWTYTTSQVYFFLELSLSRPEASFWRSFVGRLPDGLAEEVHYANASPWGCTANCGASCDAIGGLPSSSFATGHDGQPSILARSIGRWVHEGYGESPRVVALHLLNGMVHIALSNAHGTSQDSKCSIHTMFGGVELDS